MSINKVLYKKIFFQGRSYLKPAKILLIPFLVFVSTLSCSNNLTQNPTNSGFKIKNLEESEPGVSFKGGWESTGSPVILNESFINDVSSGFANKYTLTDIKDSSAGLAYRGPWTLVNDTRAIGGSYHYSSGLPYDIVNNKTH